MAPNLTHSGTVLLLNGVTMEATEAAGEFAIARDFPSVLYEGARLAFEERNCLILSFFSRLHPWPEHRIKWTSSPARKHST